MMRSTVWLNVILGVLNLIPAYPLDAGRMLRGGFSRTHPVQSTRPHDAHKIAAGTS